MTSAAKQTAPEAASLARVLHRAHAEVEFRGLFKVVLHLGDDERRRVPLSRLGESLGLDGKSLRDRVNATPALAEGRAMVALPCSRGAQWALALDLRCIPALLLTIDVSRVKEELRPRLVEIQKELTGALASYVFDGVAVNPEIPQPASPSLRAEFRPVVDGRIGEPIIIDPATGRPMAQTLRAEDIVTICAAAVSSQFASQMAAIETRFAAERAADRAFLERVLLGRTDGHSAGPGVGAGFARELCRDLTIYAEMMALPGDRPAIKMWRGTAETALRSQLDFSGRGAAWRRLPESKRGDARIIIETMLDTATKVRGQRDREAHGDLFKKHH